MRKIISTVLAGALLGTTMVASATPAMADSRHDGYIQNYYRDHDRDDDYWRWRHNRSSWDDREYRGWYRHHHRGFDNPAAAIFGFAAGALAAGAANALSDSHVARCEDRYRSYNHERDAYYGYDGQWHRCRL